MKYSQYFFYLIFSIASVKLSIAQMTLNKTNPPKKEIITKDGTLLNQKNSLINNELQTNDLNNEKVIFTAMIFNHPNIPSSGANLEFKGIIDTVGGFKINNSFTEITPPIDGYYMISISLTFYPIITNLKTTDAYDVYLDLKQNPLPLFANTSFNNINPNCTFISNNYHHYTTIIKLKGGNPLTLTLSHKPISILPPFQFSLLKIGSGIIKIVKLN